MALACDVTREEALENLVQKTLEAFAKITILVNNAGGGGPKPFDMPMDDFIWAYKLNVFSAFRLCQLCAGPLEEAGGGAILNISSMAGENKNFRMTSYGSSKAAMNHLTRNLAFDLGPKNIRVNAIAPRSHQDRRLGLGADTRDRKNDAQTHPPGSFGASVGYRPRRPFPRSGSPG